MLTLALHITVEDSRDLNLPVPTRRKNLSKRTANCTKAKQTYTQATLPFEADQQVDFIEI
jgi:hypothetical protein